MLLLAERCAASTRHSCQGCVQLHQHTLNLAQFLYKIHFNTLVDHEEGRTLLLHLSVRFSSFLHSSFFTLFVKAANTIAAILSIATPCIRTPKIIMCITDLVTLHVLGSSRSPRSGSLAYGSRSCSLQVCCDCTTYLDESKVQTISNVHHAGSFHWDWQTCAIQLLIRCALKSVQVMHAWAHLDKVICSKTQRVDCSCALFVCMSFTCLQSTPHSFWCSCCFCCRALRCKHCAGCARQGRGRSHASQQVLPF